jgi:hypothetical protein
MVPTPVVTAMHTEDLSFFPWWLNIGAALIMVPTPVVTAMLMRFFCHFA